MVDRDGIVMPEPLAYFLTWPTYGTWLPGDERGWVLRDHGHQLPSRPRRLEAEARMTEDACRLDAAERQLVEQTVQKHCRLRGWTLHAVNCRSNHLHVVVTADCDPDQVRDQLKAWTVRVLKGLAHDAPIASAAATRKKWWAERGSKRYLNDDASLEAAVVYVREGQDGCERSTSGAKRGEPHAT